MPDLTIERRCRDRGGGHVAGVDEAGRGPLAGPVVAAAVILPEEFDGEGLDDSKRLTARRRAGWFERLTTGGAVAWAAAVVEADEIDRINILRATHRAMAEAVRGLGISPGYCLIDGLPVVDFPWPHEAIVKGDSKSLTIAAASVVAKVTRDRLMEGLAEEFPQYGFERHKGYGTREHLDALRRHGPCRAHRRSFQPVAQLSLPLDGA